MDEYEETLTEVVHTKDHQSDVVKYSNWFPESKRHKWCALCQQPIIDVNNHLTGRSSAQDRQRHWVLEMIFQTYLCRTGHGSRVWDPVSLYRSAGCFDPAFAQYVHSVVHASENERRVALVHRLHALGLPVFHGRDPWADSLTCWTGRFTSTRGPGFHSIRPIVAHLIMRLFPGLLPGPCSAWTHLLQHEQNMGSLYRILNADMLFAPGQPKPQLDKGRSYVLKRAGDNLYDVARGFAPRSSRWRTQDFVLSQWCLRALAAECLIVQLQDFVPTLEAAWCELGMPVEEYHLDISPSHCLVIPSKYNEIGKEKFRSIFSPES